MAANNVFRLPELIKMILSFLPWSKSPRLLPVNRACYALSKRAAWKYVDRPDDLFELTLNGPLPDIDDPRQFVQSVHIPESMSEDAKSLFLERVSLVRTITYPTASREIYFNWRGFENLRDFRPYFMLKEIRLRGCGDNDDPEAPSFNDVLAFLRLFMGPTTASLRFLSAPNIENVTAALRCALDNGSPLKSLSILSRGPTLPVPPGNRSIPDSIGQFTSLTNLAFSARWVDGHLFSVMRLLPRLQELEIRDFRPSDARHFWSRFSTNHEPSSEGFLSLTRLRLRHLLATDALRLLQADPSLVSRITTLQIELCVNPGPGRQFVDENIANDIFDILRQRSQHLDTLAFAYPSIQWPYLMSFGTFERLYSLDLERLTLANVSVQTNAGGFGFENRWPRLTRLMLLNQEVEPQDIIQFAGLGRLEYLGLSLPPPQEENLDFLANAALDHVGDQPNGRLVLDSRATENDHVKPCVLEQYARFLVRLWPGLIIRRQGMSREVEYEESVQDDDEDEESNEVGLGDDATLVCWIETLAEMVKDL
ncbi:hypothetical protein FRC08_006823 [Ceratobasidium sp. 394]|nr:hypothetical protein FRC08_006823 [Ceratobasidium sp. 394]KAG9101274.1 hypothetical protein FS749_008498 [Ceratobasidium sp. UAMH 11750]